LYAGDINDDEIVSLIDAYQIYLNRNDPSGYSIYDITLDGLVTLIDVMDAYNNRGSYSSVPTDRKNAPVENVDPEIEAIMNDIGSKDKTVTVNISNPRLEGDYFKMEVQVKRTNDWSGDGIGGSDFFFARTAGAFTGIPTTSNVNVNITESDKYTLSLQEASGKLYLQLDYNYFGGTGSDWILGLNTYETVCTVSWEINNPALTSGIVWDQASTVVSSTSLFDFITVSYSGDGDITLPVELSSFTALYGTSNESVELRWDTASETDVNGFNIYRSDVKDLARAGRHINYSLIPAAGTTSEPQNYNYADVVADVYVTHYYWLEVVDFGGTSSFHGPYAYTPGDIDGDSTPDLIASTELIGNFPNPAVNSTKIKYQIKGTVIDQNATISVYNVRGELVKTL
jgi:hypothetical protein